MGLQKTFLAIGIAILLALFIGYAVYVIYPTPKYDYAPNTCYRTYDCSSQFTKCDDKIDAEIVNEYSDCRSDVMQSTDYKTCQELLEKCNEEYTKQQSRYKHARNTFYILFILSLIAIFVGAFFIHLEGISSGILGGGILVFIYGLIRTWTYWVTFNKFIKLGFLAIILIVVIYIGYKKIEDKL